MSDINFKKSVSGTIENIVAKLTEQLKTEGFGILTRIDFHAEIWLLLVLTGPGRC